MNHFEQEKAELENMLQKAILFELSTIPVYMTALISIKPGTNLVAANLIRSVMMEEMLHMTLAGNILTSIGGKMVIGADHIPSYPLSLEFNGQRFKDREFEVNLAPMTRSNIETFTRIELPDGWEDSEQELSAIPEIDVPGYTVGQFYKLLEYKLITLCEKYGEPKVFIGKSHHQINLNYYWSGGGKPIKISSLSEAKEAIEVIMTQGEGTSRSIYDGDEFYFDQRNEVAHFFRFREILFGRYYQHGDDPHAPPTGDQFEVDYKQVYPVKVNAVSSDYKHDPQMSSLNQDFNRKYSTMLRLITEAFNGSPDALYTAILNSMHNMASIAHKMVSTPIHGHPNVHGAPSFEWINLGE